MQVEGCSKSYTHPSSLRKHLKTHESKGELLPVENREPIVVVANKSMQSMYHGSPGSSSSSSDYSMNSPGQDSVNFQANPFPSPMSQSPSGSESFEPMNSVNDAYMYQRDKFASYSSDGNFPGFSRNNTNPKSGYQETESFSNFPPNVQEFADFQYTDFAKANDNPFYPSNSSPLADAMHQSQIDHFHVNKNNMAMYDKF